MLTGFVACLLAAVSSADEGPAPGRLLVATEEVRGPFFQQTVVLLLHYNEEGALGLVINRPMAAVPDEVLPDLEGIHDYEGTLYWGGPVDVASLRAIMRMDDPPDDALPLFDAVYQVPLDRTLSSGTADATRLRFYVGYAGWAAGQLDAEILRRSWRILPATEALVFADDMSDIWRRLTPPQSYRASGVGPGQVFDKKNNYLMTGL